MSIMRVRLTRGEESKWLLGSEFLDMLHQAVALSGLPVAGRAAPVPRFRIQGGPPLPTGFTSQCEYVDIELLSPVTSHEFRQRLQPCLPSDMLIVWARRLPKYSKSLKASLRRIRYTVMGLFERRCATAFHHAEHWPLVQVKKDRHRVLDLKQSVTGLRVESDRLIFEIEMREEGMPKPDEVVASVFGRTLKEATGYAAERTAVHLDAPFPPHKAAGNT